MNKLKSIFNKLKIGLALGMKSADEELVHSNASADDVDSGIHQQVTDKRVAKHLLKGEVTQEVEELRYRTYLVDRESKEFDFFSPVKAVRKPKDDNRKISYENNEDLKLITIQENRHIGDDVYDALEKIDAKNVETDDNGEVRYNLGKIQKKHNYTIKLGRNEYTVPRYRLEEYTKKLVCFSMDENEEKVCLDFYVSKYPNDKDWKSKGFVREIEKIRDTQMRSDIFDFRTVAFQTSHAYRLYDGISFKYDKVKFDSISEYDGDYVIHFNAETIENGTDFFDKFYNENMAKKYKEKAEKESTINFDPYAPTEVRKYKCSICGKEVSYSVADMEALQYNDIDADDETQQSKSNVTEYMDMEMTEQTFGRFICKDCLEKNKVELMAIYNETH